MHPANQRLGKPDKLSQGAHKQTSYPRVQWENTLYKREATEPQGEKNFGTCKQERSLREGNVRSRNKSKNIGLPMLQEARSKA